MMPQSEVQLELFKALLTLTVTVVTLAFGWGIGQRLSAHWAIRQKLRELELAAVNDFYSLYGEFFQVWKLWEDYLDSLETQQTHAAGREQTDFAARLHPDPQIRWQLLGRASAAEGRLESLLVKLAAEKPLSDRSVEVLGRFRQAYQTLRESISRNSRLGWNHPNHPQYLSWKRLASLVANLILTETAGRAARVGAASELERITSVDWEDQWVISDQDWARLRVGGRDRG